MNAQPNMDKINDAAETIGGYITIALLVLAFIYEMWKTWIPAPNGLTPAVQEAIQAASTPLEIQLLALLGIFLIGGVVRYLTKKILLKCRR